MDFLKRHYEKILLGVMLAGLIGVLVFMLFYIASDKAAMEIPSSSAGVLKELKVKVGDTVIFKNNDTFAHNIYSLSDVKPFVPEWLHVALSLECVCTTDLYCV